MLIEMILSTDMVKHQFYHKGLQALLAKIEGRVRPVGYLCNPL